jgi:hypothetical protein
VSVEWSFSSVSSRFDRHGHRARSGGNEVLMQVLNSLGSKIRKWLGLDRKPAGKLHGTGA